MSELQIKTIIFDCFGVVCDPVLGGWYKDNMLKRGLKDENLPNLFRQFDMGILTEENIVDYFLKYEGINQDKEAMRKDIDSYLRIDESLIEIIKKLRNKGFKIILLSNANSSFFERKIYPTFPQFKSFFDDIIISSIVQMVKPDPEIYLHTLEKIASHPKEALFVDDSKINVDAAISLGIHGHLYTNSTSFAEHLNNLGININ